MVKVVVPDVDRRVPRASSINKLTGAVAIYGDCAARLESGFPEYDGWRDRKNFEENGLATQMSLILK